MLFQNWYLLGVEKNSSHAHKTGPWYLLEVLFKISDKHPYPFYIGVPLQGKNNPVIDSGLILHFQNSLGIQSETQGCSFIQLKLSLRPLSEATSCSYDHFCKTPFELQLKAPVSDRSRKRPRPLLGLPNWTFPLFLSSCKLPLRVLNK